MALIGSTVDPRMFVQDYSGFANAAAIRAAGMMNFGQQVGGAIADYGKESKALKAEIAKGKSALQFAKAYHPELADQIDQIGQIFNDPSKSQVEQAAAGSQMGDFVAAILGGEQFKKEMGLKEREAKLREDSLKAELNAPGPAPRIENIYTPEGGQQQSVWNPSTQRYEPVPASIGGDPTLQDLPALDANGNPIEQAADMWGANGMVLPDKGAIGNGIEQAARLGYKAPEGGQGEVMTGEQISELVKQNAKIDATPIGNGQYRVKGTTFGGGPMVSVDSRNMGNIPPGYQIVEDQGKTRMEPIPGSPADAEAKALAAASENKTKGRVVEGNLVIQDTWRALEEYGKSTQNEGVAGSLTRSIEGKVPGSPIQKAKTIVDSVKSFVVRDAIAEMRAKSPTGATGYGQLNQTEFKNLETSVGALNPEDPPAIFKANSLRVIEKTLDTIHGTREDRQQWIKEGRITAEDNAKVETMYPPTTMNARGEVVPRNPAIAPNIGSGSSFFTPEFLKIWQEMNGN